MTYWLLKSEPEEYSYAVLEREGKGIWDGVKNALALKHLSAMKIGDLALFYHTGKERRVVGIAEVCSQPYPDPKLNEPKRLVVEVRAVRSLLHAVTLAQIKQDSHFQGFDLIRLPRLSVMPVSAEYWQRILHLGGEN